MAFCFPDMAGNTFTHCLTKFKLILAQKEKEDIGGLGRGVLGLRKENEKTHECRE